MSTPALVRDNGLVGPAGTTVTPANSGEAGHPFDAVSAPGAAVLRFDDAVPAPVDDSGHLLIQNATGALNPYVQWNLPGTWPTTIYFRFYARQDTGIAVASWGTMIGFYNSAGLLCGGMCWGGGRQIFPVDNSQTQVAGVTSPALANAAWGRFEGWITSHASAGQLNLQWFTGANVNGSTPTGQGTTAATANTRGGAMTQVRIGHLSTNNTSAVLGQRIGPVAVSDSPIGPWTPPPVVTTHPLKVWTGSDWLDLSASGARAFDGQHWLDLR